MSHLLIITSHYPPDQSAGAFRMNALVQALQSKAKKINKITVLTGAPSRVKVDRVQKIEGSVSSNIQVIRVKMLQIHGKKYIEIINFLYFSIYVFLFCIFSRADTVFCTTSKFFTSFVSTLGCRVCGKKLIIDVRDLFSDTIQSLYQLDNKSKVIKVLNLLEKFTYKYAAGIIVVSPIFKAHIVRVAEINNAVFIPNGIDKEFVFTDKLKKHQRKEVINITYAGNLGEAQGIDLLFPELLKNLPNQYKFNIYGQGARVGNLKKNCTEFDSDRIQISAPVNREELTKIYIKADILFLCLKPLPAFEKVIPSKVFEFGASRKPIVAVVSGELLIL